MTDLAARPPTLVVRGRKVDLSEPVLMGIVNASPDSFSDGGAHPDVAAQVARAVELVEDGAAIVDVGGQSGITGVPEVDAAEEARLVVPLVEGILAAQPDVLVSVDTYRPAVVSAVLDAGAAIVNDISGLRYPEVASLCAAAGAGLVLMHTRARPKQSRRDPALYDDVDGDVTGHVVSVLASLLSEVEARGLRRDAVLLDPGPDFAKTPWQTVTVLREIDRVRALGRPLLLALSRKDFVGAITGQRPRQRLAGTLAAIGHLTRHDGAAGSGGSAGADGNVGHDGTPCAGGTIGTGRATSTGRANGADEASGAVTGGGCVLRVHDVAAVADYLAVAAVLDGRADIPPDLELPLQLRRERPSS